MRVLRTLRKIDTQNRRVLANDFAAAPGAELWQAPDRSNGRFLPLTRGATLDQATTEVRPFPVIGVAWGTASLRVALAVEFETILVVELQAGCTGRLEIHAA